MSAKPDAFDDFVRTVEPRLASYLRHAARSVVDAEDVFQEVCFAAHRAWSRVRTFERPAAWAVHAAHHRLVNLAKRRAVERRATNSIGPTRTEAAADEPARAREAGDAIATSLARLDPAQRAAVCMKIWGELTWREIGDALGVSDDTAARLCARGLRALEPRLREFRP